MFTNMWNQWGVGGAYDHSALRLLAADGVALAGYQFQMIGMRPHAKAVAAGVVEFLLPGI
ncbi:hypothetical protein RGR602_PB00466 (plasmid) [Rhizobium gallicum bv. gallicum R602sp]|uniref:Uncharacterized protein n=1 Tax=Rhizobium gallicum bv. gallicum R602sp TaxID=1041138 RepID=A0A0B4XB88_9HYPH|nr:hypothetical protein RGR602_PB00466 [Rhizobium gallicum bv. gallicum R602sp]